MKLFDTISLLPRARGVHFFLVSLVLMTLAACSTPPADHPPGEPWDPYEQTNRAIHEFNKDMDTAIVAPVARVYSGIVGDEIETAFINFSNNLSVPRSVINNILQLNGVGATEDTYRFIVNSTVGLFGFVDVATDLKMPTFTDADFGETLAVWGVQEGAYRELPFLGPSTQRDSYGLLVDRFLDPFDYIFQTPQTLWGLGTDVSTILTQRERFGSTIDSVLYESADSYAQSRSLYLQNRRFEVGNSSTDDLLDPFNDPFLDLEAPE